MNLALMFGKSYALKNVGFRLLSGFVNGCGYQGVQAVKDAYKQMFIMNAPREMVIRMSGFKCARLSTDALSLVFQEVTITLHSNSVDIDFFMRNSRYQDAIIEQFCRIMI